MPIYEYRCTDCGHEFEATQKMSDAPLSVCPQCSGKVVKKVSLGAFVLKGGGWYQNEYGSRRNDPPECGSGSGTGHTCCAGCSHKQ